MSVIRRAREDETPELVAIGMRAWESAVVGWIDVGILRANAERAFVAFTFRNFMTVDVVDVDGMIVAWAAREKLDNHITDLWVDPIWQGQGFGGTLLGRLEEEIVAQDHEQIKIETHSENTRAIKFLRKHGYSINWMTAAWSPQLDRDVDTVGLVKRLSVAEPESAYAEF